MLDVNSAYEPVTPQGPGACQGLALVQVDDDLVEMHVFGSWIEGKRTRFNLASFHNGTISRVLRGWSGDLVALQG